MIDEYHTLAARSEGYYMDRQSKFYAYAIPVDSESDASQFLQSIKKEHPKARHFCTALRLFPDASLERSNDDGEPSGSAGKPILGQIVKHGLTNVFIVVVRYFGVTKLGVPGLIEAYKTAAATAIEEGQIVHKKILSMVKIHLSYEQWPGFTNLIRQQGIPVLHEEFDPHPSLTIGLPKSTTNADLVIFLKHYSQHDYATIAEYANLLHLDIEILNQEEIV